MSERKSKSYHAIYWSLLSLSLYFLSLTVKSERVAFSNPFLCFFFITFPFLILGFLFVFGLSFSIAFAFSPEKYTILFGVLYIYILFYYIRFKYCSNNWEHNYVTLNSGIKLLFWARLNSFSFPSWSNHIISILSSSCILYILFWIHTLN